MTTLKHMMLVIGLVALPVSAEPVLWEQNFEDGKADGWSSYTHALEHDRALTPSARTTHGGSRYALAVENGTARVRLRKSLGSEQIAWPGADDTFLSFSYHCQANASDQDEVIVSVTGRDGEEQFGRNVTFPVRTGLNRWHTVTLPMAAFGRSDSGTALIDSISISYFRPRADDHVLVIDDVRIARGLAAPPVLIEPGSLRAMPRTISPNGDGFDDAVSIHGEWLAPSRWTVRIVDAAGETVREIDGDGPLRATWDAKDSNGGLVTAGTYDIELRSVHAVAGHAGRIERSRVVVVDATPAPSGSGVGAWSVGAPYGVDRRFAVERIVEAPAAQKLSRTPDAIHVVLGRLEAVAFPLRIAALEHDLDNVSISIADLPGLHNTILRATDIRFNAIEYERLPGGYLWEDITALPESFELKKGATRRVEGVVRAGKDLLPGRYEGQVRVGADSIEPRELSLTVDVVDRVNHRPWWQGDPLRIMLCKYQIMPRPEFFEHSEKGYRLISAAGFNMMIPYTAYKRHEMYSTRAEKYGMKSIARSWILCVGSPDTKPPRFLIANGTELPIHCPYSEERWGTRDVEPDPSTPLPQVKILANAKYYARMSLEYPVVGMVVDFELYEVGRPRPVPMYTYCYCDRCIERFRQFARIDIPELAPAERQPWLKRRDLLTRYRRYEDDELKRYARMMREVVHEINPKMTFFIFPWEGHFPELVGRELGTQRVPVLLGTEHTYGQGGYHDFIADEDAALRRNRGICLEHLRELKMADVPCVYLPGVMPGYHAWRHGEIPSFCERNATTVARHADGYWVFFQRTGETWDKKKMHDHGYQEYLDAFGRANRRIVAGTYDR
ncbi:MAG: hypothetical protein CMJ18_08785 [Phycisphaeraceae bacterium]|nr:hypothetical protein [Phycisphaeraceae bacterium]